MQNTSANALAAIEWGRCLHLAMQEVGLPLLRLGRKLQGHEVSAPPAIWNLLVHLNPDLCLLQLLHQDPPTEVRGRASPDRDYRLPPTKETPRHYRPIRQRP